MEHDSCLSCEWRFVTPESLHVAIGYAYAENITKLHQLGRIRNEYSLFATGTLNSLFPTSYNSQVVFEIIILEMQGHVSGDELIDNT